MHVPPNLMKISKTLRLLTSNHFKHLLRVGGRGWLGWSGGVVEPLFERFFCDYTVAVLNLEFPKPSTY